MLAVSADEETKEAEMITCSYNENITDRVKCFKKNLREIMKADVPKQEEEIEEVEKKLRLLN